MESCTSDCNHTDPEQCCGGGVGLACICLVHHPQRAKAAFLERCRDDTKREMESMIENLYDEIRNLERFRDNRQLIATADLKYHWDQVCKKAEVLEDAFNEVREEEAALADSEAQ
jgi:vacuolar-type H+-ATPase subunit E/Vma4